MQEPERPSWFVGDLSDPWVVAIADRLPRSFERRQTEGEIPDTWIVEERPPGLIVLHRPILTPLDIERIARLRARSETPTRVILCCGPHVRHDDLVRSARLFDAVLPEATAAETIRRVVDPKPRAVAPRPMVQVVSALHDIRLILADICRSGGYLVERRDDPLELTPHGLTVWDVPVLENGWPDRLSRRAQTSTVIALLGFADRAIVTQAREAGAAACLEWPCDVDDLISVLDRTAALPQKSLADPGHLLPPMPVLIRRSARTEVVDPRRST